MRAKSTPIYLFLFLIITLKIEGQHFSYGFKVGIDKVNLDETGTSIVGFSPYSHNPRMSFDVGLVMRIDIAEKAKIQFEPGFIEKGAENQNYGYITIPVVLLVSPFKELSFEIGPEIGFSVYAKTRSTDGKIINYTGEKFRNPVLSGVLGLSLNFSENVSFVVCGSLGLSPIYTNTHNRNPLPPVYTKTFVNYVGAGLKLFINKKKQSP